VGRTAVVVDDGLITSLTLAAALSLGALKREPALLVAATPVGRVDGLARMDGRGPTSSSCPRRDWDEIRRGRPGERHLRPAGTSGTSAGSLPGA
jgi:hypothetical protein